MPKGSNNNIPALIQIIIGTNDDQWHIYASPTLNKLICSAVDEPKFMGAHQTTHPGKLGRQNHFLVAQIILTYS